MTEELLAMRMAMLLQHSGTQLCFAQEQDSQSMKQQDWSDCGLFIMF